MFFTAILRKLDSTVFKYATHHAKDGRREEAFELVRKHYEKRQLEARRASHAIIV